MRIVFKLQEATNSNIDDGSHRSKPSPIAYPSNLNTLAIAASNQVHVYTVFITDAILASLQQVFPSCHPNQPIRYSNFIVYSFHISLTGKEFVLQFATPSQLF